MQRFGPINLGVGWRRLNVLFTRSKKRMHIFSSMGSEDILVSERTSRGVKALKDFLAYAETGYIHQPQHTGRAPDSDFEIAVANSLRDAGFETEPQVGVVGFFIDLAVKDPVKPGRYLMGIECDGASYHSAKSVRDRDRLRQKVLEDLGWRIHRIWSTDWFKNPQAVLLPLFDKLNHLKSHVPPNNERSSESGVLKEIISEQAINEQNFDQFIIKQDDSGKKLEKPDRNTNRKQEFKPLDNTTCGLETIHNITETDHLYNLGCKYRDGKGLKKNYEKALYWFHKAAKQNNSDAQYALAGMYWAGQGVEADTEKVVHWYREAAKQGHLFAQCNLGLIYENAEGVQRDTKEAIYWLRKAADQGNKWAQDRLSHINLRILA